MYLFQLNNSSSHDNVRGLVAKVLVGLKFILGPNISLALISLAKAEIIEFCSCEASLVLNNLTNLTNLILNVWVLKFENKEHKSPILHPIIYFILRIILKSTSSNQKSNNEFFSRCRDQIDFCKCRRTNLNYENLQSSKKQRYLNCVRCSLLISHILIFR